MNKKQPKRRRDIKTKLLAAIGMLLVSSIMMVSTTYAWFTLSTAPEVKGINTAVGANGNLEMALLPTDGLVGSITSNVGDYSLEIEEKNVTWGNLVDVSDSTVYGLNKITLFPSALNAATSDANGNPTSLADIMLKTPTYGADGRPSDLIANTATGYFDSAAGSFTPNDLYGVRAVGTASGMTDRQLDYRNALSAANTAKAQAANQASRSLNSNGSALANIAIEYGMGTDTAEFDSANVASLRAIIDDLQGTNGVLDRIETAYIQYILAFGASAATGAEDTAWSAVKGLVTADGATLDSILTGLAAIDGVTLPAALTTAIDKYEDTVAAVAAADTALQALEDELDTDASATFTWEEIRTAMTPLANPGSMTINGIDAGEVKEKLGELVSSVTTQGGLKVIMGTGAGVYADIADQCGDYTASITIERVEYNTIVLNNMAARMETDSSITPPYLDQIKTAVSNRAPASGAVGTMPITDMYGFIVDLAFRTNAADSKLLLQVEAEDRIYDGNTNEETLGAGSSMTFKATTADFDDDQVKGLMSAIRIVFFNPNNNAVVATAKLDTAAAALGADGWTAKLYLYTMASTTTYELAGEGQTATHILDADGVTYRAPVDAEVATHVAVTSNPAETKITSNEIMALTQNQAAALSVLVYLDGNYVTNSDVAATDATSMTGTMNLQFASSANLVPMEYAALNIPAETTTP